MNQSRIAFTQTSDSGGGMGSIEIFNSIIRGHLGKSFYFIQIYWICFLFHITSSLSSSF